MKRSHEILKCFQGVLSRTKGIKAYAVTSDKHGSSLAFIETESKQCYVLSLHSINSIVEVADRAEKPLMYSDVIKED